MEISAWLIVVVLLIILYQLSQGKKPKDISEVKQEATPFSYKLEVNINPWWYNIYKKFYPEMSDEDFGNFIGTRIKDLEKESDKNYWYKSLWGTSYVFTEYYDSVSGLTSRFMRVFNRDETQNIYPVDDFSILGYVFGQDGEILDKNASEEERNRKAKLNLEIGENFIRNDNFDPYIGGRKIAFDYTKENYLFKFPLQKVFNFLLQLGNTHYGLEQNPIISWPDEITKYLTEQDIQYDISFEFEPDAYDLEQYKDNFTEKWVGQKIATRGEEKGSFTAECIAYYSVNLKIFRPGENDRIEV